jgi:prepilin-type processing-associated H-X9-DG protein
MKAAFLSLTAIIIGLSIATFFLGLEGAAYLVFGWVPFLSNTLPRIQVDWPSIVLGAGAFAGFVIGLHWVARALIGQKGVPWKLRSSLICSSLIVIVFAAGVAVIGVVHQIGWLVTAREPLMVRSVQNGSNNLRFMAIAIDGGGIPKGGTFAEDGTMLHSWETALAPYHGYVIEYDPKKPWNDPVNQATFKLVYPVCINPDLRGAPIKDSAGYGLSHYAANSHVMAGNYAVSTKELGGNKSTTILIGEVNGNFKPWGHPVNWRDPVIGLNRSPDGFGGRPGAGGANLLMCDGSVRFLNDRLSPDVLRALSSPRAVDKKDVAGLEGMFGPDQ